MKKIIKEKKKVLLHLIILFVVLLFISCTQNQPDESGSDSSGSQSPADETAPEKVVISGIVDGGIYEIAVTPAWDAKPDMEDSAVLTKNSEEVTYQKGDEITEDGSYSLTVTRKKITNNKIAVTTVKFSISKDSPAPEKVIITGVTNGNLYDTAVIPAWNDKSGMEDSAVLNKDSEKVAYQKGDEITEDGIYTLIVTRRDTANNKSAITSVNFMINTSQPENIITTNNGETGQDLNIFFYIGGEFNNGYKPLYTIWVEDLDGNFIQNLFVCDTPATNIMRFNKSFVSRPEALPYWMHKAGKLDPYNGITSKPTKYNSDIYLAYPLQEEGDPVPADLDSVTGATQYSDFQLKSKRVNDSFKKFRILMEINKSGDGNDFYKKKSEMTDNIYNDIYYDGSQPSVIYSAVIDVNSKQKFYTMNLYGAGHFAGRNGELNDTSKLTTALKMIDKIIIHLK